MHLYKRPSGGPPQLLRSDHRISQESGTTMAIETSYDRVQMAKKRPRPTYEERLLELIRETGVLRRELNFYRSCFEPSRNLTSEVWDVANQLMLTYYWDPNGSEDSLKRSFELAEELRDAVVRYEKVMVEAEEEWVSFWRDQQKLRDAKAGNFI